MGRYTTMQTFSDQDAQGAAVPYTAATTTSSSVSLDASTAVSSDAKKDGGLRIKRVDNVSGSGAGAGSGEFHTYRAARRRYEALALHRPSCQNIKILTIWCISFDSWCQ